MNICMADIVYLVIIIVQSLIIVISIHFSFKLILVSLEVSVKSSSADMASKTRLFLILRLIVLPDALTFQLRIVFVEVFETLIAVSYRFDI